MRRILVITREAWTNDNGIGNTLSDFFSELKDFEIYSLCLREAPKVTELSKRNFYISEGQLIKFLLKKGVVGKITEEKGKDFENAIKEKKLYDQIKKINLTIFLFIREILWGTGVWKNSRLNSYLDEIKPDVIFFPDFPCVYAHKVLQYIQKRTKAKVAIFHADDCYTLRQISFSPMFWIYRFYLRKWVKKSVGISNIHYAISDIQKKDYDKTFHVNNKLLTKCADFSEQPQLKVKIDNPLKLVYTGNIGLNRWKSLAIIVKTLKKINYAEIKAQLYIYTGNEITNSMRKVLEVKGTSYIMGRVDPEDILSIQEKADILVHVESIDLRNRLIVRQSFSTKIVDYLKRGRAILAVGPKEVASIKHLIDNNCAIVSDNQKELYEKMKYILKNKEELNEIAKRAYECGNKYHNRIDVLHMLHDDLMNV